jgi:hypothetical protein
MSGASPELWSENVAVGWVLTRNLHFARACARSDEPFVVHGEAYDCRRASAFRDAEIESIVAAGGDAAFLMTGARRPVMLFPSVEAARDRLLRGVKPTGSKTFLRSAVLAQFPPHVVAMRISRFQ